jgi:RimJ/RimL family protein N-acetyltransferase
VAPPAVVAPGRPVWSNNRIMGSVLRPGLDDPLPIPALGDGAVTLRPWREDDLPALIAAASDPLIQRFRYSLPSSEADARRWLQALAPDRLAGRRLEMAITRDAEAVGSISLAGAGGATAELRYWLLAGARGQGLASAAVRLVAAWAMQELGVERLALKVEPENEASRRLAERCGFVLEERRPRCLTFRTPRAS